MSTEPATHERKINISKTQSVEWEFEIDFSATTVPASLSYTDNFEGWLSRAPVAWSAHPDIPALLLKKIKGSRQEGGLIKVTLSYENNSASTDYPGRKRGPIKRYHMEPGAGEEPLLTSYLFKDLTETEREAALEFLASPKSPEDWTNAKAKLKSTGAVKLLEKVRKGIDAYRSPTLIWVERFTTSDLDDVDLPKILKTTSNPPGDCPAATERNWLRLPPSVSPHDDGKNFDIENRWELSLRGNWDEDLYPAGG